MTHSAKVAVVMGSQSDWQQMREVCVLLDQLGIAYDKAVVSAHRMPDEMFAFAQSAAQKGYEVIIAGAGGAAHLPGMIAAKTTLPVIGVPIKSSTLNGIDSLLSIVQMPAGVPVATMSIGVSGAKNAALYAARQLAVHDESVRNALENYRQTQHQLAQESSDALYD
ncbi:MAG: 5-(carboxyamino)imidazole ribonucleotide mutase [Aerococcaceae bacterium]|nr:5-(carboxyamino)imidazole ribonucleotide mutase [Aerococcaceae bacterium]